VPLKEVKPGTIRWLTDNGLPPYGGGGKLIGYYIPSLRLVTIIGLPGTYPDWMFMPNMPRPGAKAEPKPEPMLGGIVYRNLPRATHIDGDCSHCGYHPNPSEMMRTNEGLRRVVTCRRCDLMMRPY
jgi:hypothetical protein